jgi:hypothetical protein
MSYEAKQPPSGQLDVEAKAVGSILEVTRTEDDFKSGMQRPQADYSGAVDKTSAEEIALVRKLDWRIMPTLWAMYFLNYVSPYHGRHLS